MDDPHQAEADFAEALAGLERLNRLTFAYRPLLGFLDRLVKDQGLTSLSLLDVGAGGGDTLRAVARWGEKRGIALDLWGLDRSPWAARYAAEHGTPGGWITSDLFDLPADRRFDVVMSNLFAHHLDDAAMVRFLRWQHAHARRRWLVLDIHRHAIAWGGTWALTRALRLNAMCCHDGPVSIARGFRRADFARLLAAAGMEAEVKWVVPFRWSVSGPGAADG